MQKRILIFSLAYFPFVGGAEIAVKEITDRISMGWEFDMITLKMKPELPREERLGNINVYRIAGPKLLFPFLAFLKSLALHKKINYSAVWSIMANRAGFAALFFKFFHPKIKFLLTLQEGDPFDYPQKRAGIIWPLIKPLFSRIFIKADYIQAISNYLADWAKKMEAKCPVEVVPNGVDIKNFQFLLPDFQLKDLRNKLGIKDYEKILITTSRLVPKNAVDDAMKALQYLSDNIKFLILGAGPELENLKNLAKELGLENKVMFLGEISHRELPQYLKISDIFVRPSLSEGLGNSFLEAMACGLPIIGTPVGGIPDFLKDRETGLFAEVKNSRNIAEKIKLLFQNEALRKKIAENGKNLVVEKYNWDVIARKFRSILQSLVA